MKSDLLFSIIIKNLGPSNVSSLEIKINKSENSDILSMRSFHFRHDLKYISNEKLSIS